MMRPLVSDQDRKYGSRLICRYILKLNNRKQFPALISVCKEMYLNFENFDYTMKAVHCGVVNQISSGLLLEDDS